MKKSILIWFFLIIVSQSFSQTLTVKDSKSGQPVQLASVVCQNPHAFALTNAEGQADITVFKGAERIEIRVVGYTTYAASYAELEVAGFNIQLTPGVISMDEVVVSATRWNQNVARIPTRITTISNADMQLQNSQTSADMLGSSGQVFIQKSQSGGGSPMIRGFATNRLLISVDGVRMNTAIFRGGNLQNVINIDPFSTESAEVLFGPGSVMYGSDAIAGVMNFTTLTPQLSYNGSPLITGKASTRFSSANQEKTMHFDLNVGWKKWAYVASFSQFNFGDVRMGANGPAEYLRPFYVQRQDSLDVVVTNSDPLVQRPTAYSQINMMQKVRFQPNEKWNFIYNFQYSTTSSYARYDRHIRYKNGLPRSAEWEYGPQEWVFNSLRITHTSKNVLYDQMNLNAGYQFFEESRIDRDFNDSERRTRLENVAALSLNIDFNKSIGKKQELFYGVEAIYNDVRSYGWDEDITTGSIQNGPARYPKSTWASYAVYLTHQFNLNEKMTLHSGIRYNQFMLDAKFDTTYYPFPYTDASLNDGAVTGSLGFVYNPNKKWNIRANVSTGFRSPNVDDMGKVFDSEPGTVIVPNPGVGAEYVYNAEFGITKIFGEAVKFDITGFYTYLQNALVRRNFQLNGLDSIDYDGETSQVQAIQNAAFATVYGIQAGLEIKLKSGFGFMTRFNYQLGEEELDDATTSPLRHAAPYYGVAHLTYSISKLKLDLYTMYSGEVSYENMAEEEKGKDYIYAIDDNGNPYSPAWATLNLKMMYQFSNHFSVSGGIENALDLRYRPYSSGMVSPGRNFVISMRANF
ncbi:MAG: TonB-dependent receptor [Crocinitomicaceae bacterium]|nr:TonB-dependent receptor [Crocinitomicaceae bacterium]